MKVSTKAKVAPKPRVASGASKKKAKKVLKEIDENGTDDLMNVDPNDDSDDEPSSSSKKAPAEVRGKGKTATEMYQKVRSRSVSFLRCHSSVATRS